MDHKSNTRADILAAKSRLPLPDLLARYGHAAPSNGGSMKSPFRADEKRPSFSVFKCSDGCWGWKDHATGDTGDEISLVEHMENLSNRDATKRFLELAGGQSIPRTENRPTRAPEAAPVVPYNWQACVAAFHDSAAAEVSTWRGYSPALVALLRDRSLIGLSRGQVAFPVQKDGVVIGAHVRRKDGNGWIYDPKGVGSHPLVIGDPTTAQETIITESQWDLFSFLDLTGAKIDPRCCYIATRGAENGSKGARFCRAGRLLALMQNDETKNGKNPAEKWLQDVRTAATVPVSVIRIPSQFKDLNDAQKDGFTPAALLDAIAAAEELPPPAHPVVTEILPPDHPVPSSAQGTAAAPPPFFDPMEVIQKLDLWWKGSKYYFRREGDDGFSELNTAEIARRLRVGFGMDNKPMKRPDDPAGGVIPGQIDRLLDLVVKERFVDAVAAVAGKRAGVYDFGGGRLLVTSSPKLVEPAAGECETILAFLTTLLGEDGSLRFRLWLKFGYEALRDNRRRHGQFLVLVGPSGRGKSMLQSSIITPVLGGREADPKKWLLGDEKFNEELIASEHLKVEEIPSSVRYDDRLTLGERIKELCVNHSQRLRGLHKSAVTVKPQQRLSLSMNDEPERLRCHPPLTADLRDKEMLLRTSAENFFARYDDEEGGPEIFLRAVEKELPAFAAHLLALEVPPSLHDRRYGVRSFVDPTIEEMLFDQEPESLLLTLVDDVLFGPGSLDFSEDGTGQLNPWKGSATELRDKLTDQDSKGFMTARKLLDGAAEVCGRLLGKLAKKFPDRFSEKRTGKKRSWIIQPPSES
ncbi:MAG: hypothetical protein RLZZ408_1660 [Verrucomicrobiota bacterium]|jgi:hypothetical protein